MGRKPSRKLRAGALVKPALRRLFTPRHALHAFRLARGSRRRFRAYGDSRLAVVAELLPGGFLNYGYHEPPFPTPEEMSLADIQRAQRRYAELLADRIAAPDAPVLDVGCGMGGLIRLLLERGHDVTGLTPDRGQAAYLRQHLPDVPLIQDKFEDFDTAGHVGRFGTIITAESLQYLKLHQALPRMQELLAPEGLWIAYDYFRVSDEHGGSGHAWPDFRRLLDAGGFRIEDEADLTDNVMPTLGFMHMWMSKLALPLVDLVASDLERKRPGLHHLMLESLDEVRSYTEAKAKRVAPDSFGRSRRYRLVLIRRASEPAAGG